MLRLIVFVSLLAMVRPSAIPIWELLTYDEKVTELLKIFSNLLQQHCKNSYVAGCKQILSNHGVANLLSFDEDTLNLLDPYQRNSKNIIWNAVLQPHQFHHHSKPLHSSESQTNYQQLDNHNYSPYYEI
ncbi:rhythmically expressed gene 5 protein-like [Centruroides sculpturatus]|uniref:rhythmically expressed gene 5 protein-like n=1 Tax=Centruroides sculpturatus TaxID=218467 RepID=UPI000C6E7018|nr:rhythmically expressed gene 5 protein-like [Centruroides sculpturatus]XP_023226156.1 rhythmically expressed gene 5 protein-like [Centruroides sculpturatus]XP_023226157.1 rhythmically expressed gene 5 protein-like [Centruroides sculpturatus]